MKSWDPKWEEIFSSRSWGKYPPEELVRWVARNFYQIPERGTVKILDLGCGIGTCSWFLAREGFTVCGIDGSSAAIRLVREWFDSEGHQGEFKVGDFIELPWPDEYFDGVIDIAALTCNTFTASRHILSEVRRVLKPGGRFFSMTFKDGCWGDGTGQAIEPHTFKEISEGPMLGMGVNRYSPESEVRELYDLFDDLHLEYSLRSVEDMKHVVSHWVVTCRKHMDKKAI